MEFVEPEAAGPAEESGDEAVTDEETDLGTDWETVPSPRFCDIPSQVCALPLVPMNVVQTFSAVVMFEPSVHDPASLTSTRTSSSYSDV